MPAHKKQDDERLDIVVSVRLSPIEAEYLRLAAEADGQAYTTWARQAIADSAKERVSNADMAGQYTTEQLARLRQTRAREQQITVSTH